MSDYVWNFGAPLAAWPQLLHGLGYTLLLAVLSFVLSCVLGVLVCALRVSRSRVISLPAACFIELMRLTPLLVQMLWVYTSLAMLTGIRFSPFQAGLIALSLNSSAFLAELFRSGLQSIPRGQAEAAAALGMSGWQSMKRVLAPQTFRVVIPPLGSAWVSSFKDTSLLLVLGVPELLTQAQIISSATYRPLETFTVVGIIYLMLAYPQALLVERLYRRRNSN